MNYLEDLQKFNRRAGILLAVFSILTCLSSYFNVAYTVFMAISTILSFAISFIAMMQVYNMGHWIRLGNPFWLIYSSVVAIFMVVIIYSAGLHFISERISVSLLTGLSLMLFPCLGVFIGDFARILMGRTTAV